MKIGDRVKTLMSQERAASKFMVRKTFYLDGREFKVFEKLCKEKGRSASEVINALISDFIEEFQRKN